MGFIDIVGRLLGRPPALLKAKPGSTVWYFRRDKIAVISFIFIVFMVAVAVLAPWIAPYPNEGRGEPNIVNRLKAPSSEHLFGTGSLGRDVFSRVIYGTRVGMTAAFAIVGIAAIIGTILGGLAGYFGGWVDELIMRVTDIFLAFPPLLLAMMVAVVMDPSLMNAIIAITLVWWPWYTRLARAQALSVRGRDFVKAAWGIGVNDFTILGRHIVPNIITPVLVQGTLDLGLAIIYVSGLSFLGLGVPPPTADWGAMISEGRIYIQNGRWWIATFPGLALFLTIMAFNLLGDGIQLVTNPRARGETH